MPLTAAATLPLPHCHCHRCRLTAQGTLLAYHTSALAHYNKTALGTRLWGHQINVAGRLVAEREGLFILDLEPLTGHLPPDVYLRDMHHPRPPFLVELFNMLLNAWRWSHVAARHPQRTRRR